MAHFGMNGNSSSIFKQFGNLRHTKKPGQYDEEYVEECFSSMHFLASQDVDELILHKMIFHSVIVCSAFEEIMVRYDKLARQKEGTETSQESLVWQEMVFEQQTNTCIEVYEPFSTGSGEHFIAQHTDSKGVKCKDRFSNDLSRTDLKWYFGADNIPWHIGMNLLEVLATIAKLDSGICHLCLSIKCLSSFQDLKVFTFVKTRLRGTKYVNNLLNTKRSSKKGTGCGGQDILEDIPVIDVKDRRGMEEDMESPTKRVNADMTGNSKLGKEEAQLDGKIKTENVNKVVPGRKFGVMLHWIMNTHYKQGYSRCVWVLLLLMSLVNPTSEIPIFDRNRGIGAETAVFRNFTLLKSWCPNPENSTDCPIKDKTFDLKTDSCEYKCPPWEYLLCMNHQNKAVYFCIPKNTSCRKGIGWQIEKVEQSVDDVAEGSVVMKESSCAEEKYQTDQSKCYDACRNSHIPLYHIPEGFKIFKKGDHIYPTVLICNSTGGFYNAHNKSYIYLDDNFSQDFCTHIDVYNPCSSGQIPLHNGTCVNKCGLGFRRNETDFKCEEISGNGDTPGKTSTDGPPVSATGKSTEPTNGRNSDISPERNISSTEPGKTEHKSDTLPPYLIVIIISVVAVIFVAMWIVVILFFYKFICRGKSQDTTYLYHAVPVERDSTRNDSNKSSASSSEADVSTFDAKDGKVSVQTVAEVESLPIIQSLKGNVDPSTVVKKKTLFTGNMIIKIGNVGAINFGNGIENVQDIIYGLSKGLDIPESDVVKVKGSENDPRDSGTDVEKTDKEQDKEKENTDPAEENTKPVEENTGPAKKRGAGEEFAKPNVNSMTQLVVNGFAEYMKSVGALIYNGEVIGTVFRAGDDYAITAFHVIKRIIDPDQTGTFNYTLLEASNVYVNFNATVCETPCFEYRVRHRLSTNDPKFDYTVLQIISPVQLPKKMRLDRHSHDRLDVKSLSGIGYGDPVNSFCKVLDPYCCIISSVNSRIMACEEWLHAENNKNFKYFQGAVIAFGANPDIVTKGYREIDRSQNIFLDISMEHKGSGSPFLTSDGKVVGILTHGHPEFYFCLPAIIRPGFPKDKRFEAVLKLEYVYENIVARDPDLANNLFGVPIL